MTRFAAKRTRVERAERPSDDRAVEPSEHDQRNARDKVALRQHLGSEAIGSTVIKPKSRRTEALCVQAQ